MIRVLVADDHPVVRAGIVALVEAADDIEVVGQAGDGGEAVRLALALRPDIVLMDLRMPVLDGDEATASIVAAGDGVGVIVLTTYESDDAILRAIERGASGYLLKAAPEGEILAGIRSVARGEVALAPSIAALLVRRVAGAAGPGAAAPPVPALTDRETQVLALVAQGRSNREAARELYVSEATVKTHLLHAFEKLGVSDRTERSRARWSSGSCRPPAPDASLRPGLCTTVSSPPGLWTRAIRRRSSAWLDAMDMSGWSAEATATFWAATLAAVVGAASLVTTIVEARAVRRRLDETNRRDQWWQRWTWAMELLTSDRRRARRTGLIHAQALTRMPWILQDDMRISWEVMDVLMPPAEKGQRHANEDA